VLLAFEPSSSARYRYENFYITLCDGNLEHRVG
jgi:hypothetical protein